MLKGMGASGILLGGYGIREGLLHDKFLTNISIFCKPAERSSIASVRYSSTPRRVWKDAYRAIAEAIVVMYGGKEFEEVFHQLLKTSKLEINVSAVASRVTVCVPTGIFTPTTKVPLPLTGIITPPIPTLTEPLQGGMAQ